jgi:hypothetical protein
MENNGLQKLSANEQYEIYSRGLQSAIEQFKLNNPQQYEKAQSIGEDMMNKKYELVTGQDTKGDLLKCKNILNSILQYGLEKSDLYENELELLKKILVDTLNCVHDIEDIFKNIEEIEQMIRLVFDKVCEIENDY